VRLECGICNDWAREDAPRRRLPDHCPGFGYCSVFNLREASTWFAVVVVQERNARAWG
jgi:hypothetical protein